MSTDLIQAGSALRESPDHAASWLAYGQVLHQQGQLLRALNAYKVAAALAPHDPDTCLAHCQLLVEIGETDQAIQFLSSLPGHLQQGEIGRYLLRLRCYQPAMDTPSLMEAIERAEHLSEPAEGLPRSEHRRNEARPVRLAYLSGRWGDERWVRHILPNLLYRQRGRFELFAYDSAGSSDECLERVRRLTDRWVDVASWGRVAFQAQLLADEIDILVDVDGYAGRDLGVTDGRDARPWQLVSWLGMPWAGAADGWFADYYLLQNHLPRPTYRLPFGSMSWVPPEEIPAPTSIAPSRTAQQIVLASMNPPACFSAPVVRVWSEILRQLPTAQLRLYDTAFVDGGVIKTVQQRFTREGIESHRVRCDLLPKESWARLRLYQEVDVALDTFPVAGYMSACEAMWMGVPVVTLQGQAAWQNTTASVLASAGVREWAVDQPEAYVAKALALVADSDARDSYRRDLRETVELSPLCSGRLFARHFEHCLEQVWRAGGNPKHDGDE